MVAASGFTNTSESTVTIRATHPEESEPEPPRSQSLCKGQKKYDRRSALAGAQLMRKVRSRFHRRATIRDTKYSPIEGHAEVTFYAEHFRETICGWRLLHIQDLMLEWKGQHRKGYA